MELTDLGRVDAHRLREILQVLKEEGVERAEIGALKVVFLPVLPDLKVPGASKPVAEWNPETSIRDAMLGGGAL